MKEYYDLFTPEERAALEASGVSSDDLNTENDITPDMYEGQADATKEFLDWAQSLHKQEIVDKNMRSISDLTDQQTALSDKFRSLSDKASNPGYSYGQHNESFDQHYDLINSDEMKNMFKRYDQLTGQDFSKQYSDILTGYTKQSIKNTDRLQSLELTSNFNANVNSLFEQMREPLAQRGTLSAKINFLDPNLRKKLSDAYAAGANIFHEDSQ